MSLHSQMLYSLLNRRSLCLYGFLCPHLSAFFLKHTPSIKYFLLSFTFSFPESPYFLPVLVGIFVAVMKHSWKTTWEEMNLFLIREYSPLLMEVRAGTWRQELKQRPWKSVTYWIAFYDLLIYLFYTSQAHMPKYGTASSGLRPPTSTISQKVPHRYIYRPHLWRQPSS